MYNNRQASTLHDTELPLSPATRNSLHCYIGGVLCVGSVKNVGRILSKLPSVVGVRSRTGGTDLELVSKAKVNKEEA